MEPLADHPRPTALLTTWALANQALRGASGAGTVAEAQRLVERAMVALEVYAVNAPAGSEEHTGSHVALQRATLTELAHLLATLVPPASEDPGPAQRSTGSELELCTAPVRAGDALCLLRRSGGGGPGGAGDLVARATAALRDGDQLVQVDDDHLLVVLAGVSLPVAWRRMSGLVGARPVAGGGRAVVVHAGLAGVDDAGPAAALEAARTALHQATADAAGRIALARAA
ncbi:hypothetical protein AB0N29_01540 [Nocardioides sp. NPDC092400]|uniref:hypothetical protein n=1 Tax=Nocardioides sp. NPDC092400 TaxID=3155196 RepID=UPI00343AB7A3